MIKFCGLHAHSDSSVGDGLGKPEDHFNFALSNGLDSMALTEHGNANGFGYMIQARNKFKKKGIPFRIIFGAELYYHPDLDHWQRLKDGLEQPIVEENDLVVEDEQESKYSKWIDPLKRRHHLVVLCQNYEGYQNLCRIITESYRKGFYRFPRTDLKTLEKYNKGLIISSACIAGAGAAEILTNYEKGDEEVFKALDKGFKPLLDIFGKDRANIEIQFNKLPEQRIVNDYLIRYSLMTDYPLLATADSHYYNPNVWREREIYRLLARQTKGFKVAEEDIPKTVDELKCELYPKNGNQMFEEYCQMYSNQNDDDLDAIVLEAIERSHYIAHNQIEEIDFDKSMKLPKSFLKGADPDEKLRRICIDRLNEISKDWNKEKYEKYCSRLNYELDVIIKKQFSLYFLALKEALDKIKEKLLVNFSRGSDGGSLVCYLTQITMMDPIEHNLLFERFLSENRAEFPDCDNDVENRDEAIEILKEHFGEDNVIAISNYNTLQLKSLVKDISRLYNISFDEVNVVTSIMETEAKQPILDSIGNDQKLYVFDYDGAYKHSPTFKNFIDKYPQVGESIKVLFGQNRVISRHAGGCIVTENIESYMPVIKIRGEYQTPWGEGLTAKHLEPMGFIKYDFLGLATLRIVRRCIDRILVKQKIEPSHKNVMEFYNKHLVPDIVGQGEEEVFREVYHKGRFCGTFQFSENGVQQFCVNAKPMSITDISVITATYRPGALASKADEKYIRLKNNPDEIDNYHPIVSEILGDTYNLIIFQEQILLLANKLAGFSLSEADELRKLLVKPVTSLGDELKKKRQEAGEKFIKGCVESGVSQARAEVLWYEEILPSVSYSFNRSHSVGYSYLSYACAWLFHYYPNEWVCAYLENDPDKEAAIAEVKSLGYQLGDIDIISSSNEYSIKGNVIYPPFSSIKGVGAAAVRELLEKRKSWNEQKGLASFIDFFYDIEEKTFKNGKKKTKYVWKYSKFNKKAMDALVRLEALNGLNIFPDPFLNHAHLYRVLIEHWDDKEKQSFDLEKIISETDTTDFTDRERVEAQSEYLGTYDKTLLIPKDVLDFLRDQDILPLSDITTYPQRIWFILNDFQTKTTKNGKPYYKLTIMDIEGKDMIMNYFNLEPREGWEKKGLYWCELFQKDGWINNARGSFIKRID